MKRDDARGRAVQINLEDHSSQKQRGSVSIERAVARQKQMQRQGLNLNNY